MNPAAGSCQRWHKGQHSWRHRSEGGFNSLRYEVADLASAGARTFVEQHHYAHAYVADSRRYGLYDGPMLVGAAVFSVPVRAAVLTGPFPDLEPYTESLELGRFVLLDPVPANAESWFLARVFELARRDGLRGVVCFSDPLERTRLDGSVVMPGHVGTIYQASNARYLGRATARTLALLPDGTILNERSLQKVRRDERGHAAVEKLLRSWGAPRREPDEPGASYLARALPLARVRTLRHPGNHRYGFDLAHSRRLVSVLPYPKRDQRAEAA